MCATVIVPVRGIEQSKAGLPRGTHRMTVGVERNSCSWTNVRA